jgi:hypothetical protein
MRKQVLAAMAAGIITAAGAHGLAAEAPLSIAGFTLGRPIEEASDKVIMETALPVRYMENLQEVEIVPLDGFKSGLIAFGTCRKPRTIVRIKLKYADGSLAFYEELLKRFKQKFGEPDEYQGDPFRVFISWKWSFKDRDRNQVSLVLQHNLKDEDEKIGNAVKLTLHSQLEEDARCFRQHKLDRRAELRQRTPTAPSSGELPWGRFIPNY